MRDGGDNGGVSCPDTTVRFQKICDQCAKGDSRGQVGEVTAKTDSKSHQAEDKEREIVALQEEEGGGADEPQPPNHPYAQPTHLPLLSFPAWDLRKYAALKL